MKHFSVAFEPDGKRIAVHAGATVLEAAGRAGIILNTVCGGRGTCGKCMVELEPDGRKVPACQYRIQSDIAVIIPHTSRFFEQKILEHGIDRQIKIHPCVRKKFVKTIPEDVKMFEAALREEAAKKIYRLTPNAAEQLRQLSSGSKTVSVTAVCHRQGRCAESESAPETYSVVALERGDTTDKIFGLAIDIGTTTVVAKLIDMRNGRHRTTAASVNPQSAYGDDVVSRIAYAEIEEKLDELNRLVIGCINKLVCQLCDEAGVEPKYIYEAVVAGNTTMNHIFLKLPIKQLGQAPYEAFSVDAHDGSSKDMRLQISPVGNVHTIENIAGFVGSDTTAVALAVGINSTEKMTLVVDIGTNGEIILGTGNELYAASCAAGPAMEGARISQGSSAVAGAIERVVVNDDIDVDVIAGCPPRSICGSGLIDAVAGLLDLGIIDATGRFATAVRLEGRLPRTILSRLIKQQGEAAFVLAWNEDNDNAPMVLTQSDIREVQLAKGAIRAGIRILQKKIGIEDSQIEQVLLAGAFGNYIRRKSAVRIGLLPKVPLEHIHFVGNAAGSGAAMILLSRDCRALAGRLARQIQYVEIAHEPQFQSVFADSMLF